MADPDQIDPWSSAAKAQAAGHHEYHRRARAVFWRDGKTTATDKPKCGVGGPNHAECMLIPGHRGHHYGPGCDEWGPKGPYVWER